ncbi:uncharacterized protein ACA1_055980 [Acanthamoeba castellanii str. Neff]|uniref:Uncharacterized protein n=1 Tax=Acanthamoeba castellanii (strain ATCC 30010 / Neff) TaxID=1257118 RepID=L8H6E6_ACACF|nr:uncharacterized protein ACA1_055980 [Acanthamoeba castellanii str. Neff]ELR20812.1 hypothetical protein ACA1_055980 [Acanthamoeba castellanii str. Neff]
MKAGLVLLLAFLATTRQRWGHAVVTWARATEPVVASGLVHAAAAAAPVVTGHRLATQNALGGLVGLKPAIEVKKKKKKEKTQPKAGKKQQGPKPRSKPQAKGRGSTSQACKQNWEALLQGTQLKDETMLKGKYWHLRGKAPNN